MLPPTAPRWSRAIRSMSGTGPVSTPWPGTSGRRSCSPPMASNVSPRRPPTVAAACAGSCAASSTLSRRSAPAVGEDAEPHAVLGDVPAAVVRVLRGAPPLRADDRGVPVTVHRVVDLRDDEEVRVGQGLLVDLGPTADPRGQIGRAHV